RRQWIEHGWAEAAEGMSLVTSVMRVQQLLLARIDEALAPFDLTFARYEVLQLLSFSRTGSLPLGKIGSRLQVHPTSASSAVDRLERQGFVRRSPHPTDGRTTLIELLPAGRKVVTRATKVLNDEVFGAVGLTTRQTTDLLDLLETFRRNSGDLA
ncbi:MAG: MarR family winged helix-turn-helix transcriptional regulator, partial [Acidimicrobiales bacterium]